MEIEQELHHWENSLGTVEDCPDLSVGEFSEWMKQCTPEGNALCERWIETGEWPQPWEPDLRWQIALRLNWARQMAILLSMASWAPPERKEALRWLLVSAWIGFGTEGVSSGFRRPQGESKSIDRS
jgi:hypothetical protein